MISMLSIADTKVQYTKRDLTAGVRPYGLDISADGSVAVVANIGRGNGDNDTVSVIDLKAVPARVVETVTVGQTPEGITLSPDGKLCAVQVMNGSNKPKESAFYAPNGKLLLYRVDGTRLVPLAAAWIGRWCRALPSPPTARPFWSRTWWRRRSRCSAGTARHCRTRASASRPTGARLRSAPPSGPSQLIWCGD